MVDEGQLSIEIGTPAEHPVSTNGSTAAAARGKTLTEAERQTFEACEAMIAAGFETQAASILAVRTIREQKLWREHHASFDDYCRGRWHKSQGRINHLIQAAAVLQNLQVSPASAVASTSDLQVSSAPLPNPKQAVHLAKLKDPEDQREAWKEATADEEPVTARKVEEIVKKRQAAKGEWSDERREEAAALLDSLPDEEREAVSVLLTQPGVPADRAITALATLAGMKPEKRQETVRLFQSDDPRDKSVAVARMRQQRPEADPRRMAYEQIRPELAHCAKLFPNDPRTPKALELVRLIDELIAEIRSDEEARYRGAT